MTWTPSVGTRVTVEGRVWVYTEAPQWCVWRCETTGKDALYDHHCALTEVAGLQVDLKVTEDTAMQWGVEASKALSHIQALQKLIPPEHERWVRVANPEMVELMRNGTRPVILTITDGAQGELILLAHAHDCNTLSI
jgi:hypothetical protein